MIMMVLFKVWIWKMGLYFFVILIKDRVGLFLLINGRLFSGLYVFGWGMVDIFFFIKNIFLKKYEIKICNWLFYFIFFLIIYDYDIVYKFGN